MITLILIGMLVTVYATPGYNNSNDKGKHPIDYGIHREYFAEKREDYVPPIWYTLQQLGVTFGDKVKYAETDTYILLIVDEEKAMDWMKEENFDPNYLKYDDSYYQIDYLHISPIPENLRQRQIISISGLLGGGWIMIGIGTMIVFRKERKFE